MTATNRPAPSQTPAESPGRSRMPPLLVQLHRTIPPLWVGNGAMSLATGDAWPAVWGTAGACAIGALGLQAKDVTVVAAGQ